MQFLYKVSSTLFQWLFSKEDAGELLFSPMVVGYVIPQSPILSLVLFNI